MSEDPDYDDDAEGPRRRNRWRRDPRERRADPGMDDVDERLARVEVKVDQLVQSVERVEDKMDEQDDEIEGMVRENREKLQPIHSGVQILKYGIPILVALLGVAATMLGAVPYVG